MALHTRNWERIVISWATEPLQIAQQRSESTLPSPALEHAYEHCRRLTKQHSKTFYLASALLPDPKRQAVRALYALCRITDDIVDGVSIDHEPLESLEDWKQRVSSRKSALDHPVILAWRDTQRRFQIPDAYVDQLIDGVARDLRQTRYETFDDLAQYAYGVASTVGLMAMHIIGFAGESAVPYAVKLGVALQMTNILRDVGEDLERDRIYLPQSELADFGISEEDLKAGRLNSRWKAFMQYQINRNRQLYQESMPGIKLLNKDGRFAIGAAAELYCAILTDIEAHDYDVFSRRARIGTIGKLTRLPAIWSRSGAGRQS